MGDNLENLDQIRSPAETTHLGRCGVVVADAGSSAHVAAWLPHLPEVVGVLSTGPARRIPVVAERRQFPDVASLIDRCDWLLVGSGWAPQSAGSVRAAHRADRLVLSVLDNWVNYRARFGPGPRDLPDAVIVTDSHALEIAGKCLPGVPVLQWPNTLAEETASATASLRMAREPSDASHVLILSEPLVPAGQDGPECAVLARLPELLGALGLRGAGTCVTVRLHPIEADTKYDSLGAAWPATVSVASALDVPIAEHFAWADVVLGFNSYGLYLAAHCGLPTYTLAPRAGVETVLPAGVAAPL